MNTYTSRRHTRRLIKNWIIFSVCFVIAVSVVLTVLLAPKSEGRLDDKILLTDLSPSYEIIPFEEGCAYIDREKGDYQSKIIRKRSLKVFAIAVRS